MYGGCLLCPLYPLLVSKTVIDSGFHAVDSGFQELDSGFLFSWTLDFEFQSLVGFRIFLKLYSGFKSPGFRLQNKMAQILNSASENFYNSGIRIPLTWTNQKVYWYAELTLNGVACGNGKPLFTNLQRASDPGAAKPAGKGKVVLFFFPHSSPNRGLTRRLTSSRTSLLQLARIAVLLSSFTLASQLTSHQGTCRRILEYSIDKVIASTSNVRVILLESWNRQ